MGNFRYGQVEMDHLIAQDDLLGASIGRIGPIGREINPDRFATLVMSIVSQQISAKAATTVAGRMETAFGEMTPETLCAAAVEDIQRCGLSMRKAGYIKSLSEAAALGRLDLAAFSGMTDAEIVRRLVELPGIGAWTAEMFLIFSMERPDVVSWGDFAIKRGMMNLYGLESLSREQFELYRKRYSPYGSVASLYLWALSHE